MDVKQEKQRLPKAIICHVIMLYIQSDLYGEAERIMRSSCLPAVIIIRLNFAMEKGIKRIAFPSISTGVYGFPVKLAAHIAVNVVARFEQEFPKQIEEIYFVLFDRDTESAYEKEVDKLY